MGGGESYDIYFVDGGRAAKEEKKGKQCCLWVP